MDPLIFASVFRRCQVKSNPLIPPARKAP